MAKKTKDEIPICGNCQKPFDPEDSPLDDFCGDCCRKTMADEEG